MFYSGVVEDRNDPLEMGRYRVRVFGLHSIDKTDIPTAALPWSSTLQPTTSAAINGTGHTPALAIGTNVLVTFLDEDMQNPIILGSIAGIGAANSLFLNGQPVPDNGQFGFNVASESGYVGQPDVSKSARSGATPNLRESVQVNNIPGAFSEPRDLRPFRQYPYTQVRQSESGHVEEWDNTPGNERITTQHKSGTYQEMRPDGDQVTKVMKDNYTLVAGDNNLYVSGNVNVFIQGDVNVTTTGDYNLNVGGDYNINVQGNKYEIVNEDKTEVVNGNSSEYCVNNVDKTVGGDVSSTTVGSVTSDVYGSLIRNTYGSSSEVVKGDVSQSYTGALGVNVKGTIGILSQSDIELGSSSPVYVRGSTVDINDTSASSFSFEDLNEENQITVYDQDFEAIEADISVEQTDPELKSTQVGTVDSDVYRNTTRSSSWSTQSPAGSTTNVLNGKTGSTSAPTGFPGKNRVPSENFDKVEYNVGGATRNGFVDASLEEILAKAAFSTDIYKVEIYSGRQPGSSGGRVGSGRHDTGLAADIRLIKTEADYKNTKGIQYVGSHTAEGQKIWSDYIAAAVRLGVRGAGHSSGYMGNYGTHVDTLGQIINTSNTRVPSSYDSNTLAAWKSVAWFREAMYTADSWKYFIALKSGTRYYSKTNSKWNSIA